jgi:NTE family protein
MAVTHRTKPSAKQATAKAKKAAPKSQTKVQSRVHSIVLVLQGGGALGAYQAGVYDGLTNSDYRPDWIAGVSIGAINAALIAGNPPAQRMARLREFWERVSGGMLLPAPQEITARTAFNWFSSRLSVANGISGFFQPRPFYEFMALPGMHTPLGFYDAAPLRETLLELVDFDLINK